MMRQNPGEGLAAVNYRLYLCCTTKSVIARPVRPWQSPGTSITLQSGTKHRTGRLLRQDFVLPRNDMVVGSRLHRLLLLLRKAMI